jgi:hypothetical protein
VLEKFSAFLQELPQFTVLDVTGLSMYQDPKNYSKEKRAEIEADLRLAREYWLQKIYPYIKGRILRGIELFVAQDAHQRLQTAIKEVEDWNSQFTVAVGQPAPPFISVDVNLSAENFREPELPKTLFAENVKPEILAAIAMPLVNKGKRAMSPDRAIHNAHELLMAAEQYIRTLPGINEGANSLVNDLTSVHVTFEEIYQSNRKNSGQLPLLPPQKINRKGKSEKELLEEPLLSRIRIKAEVNRFLQQCPRSTQEDFEQSQIETGIPGIPSYEDSEDYDQWVQQKQTMFNDCMKQNQILVEDLCELRWQRFRKFWQEQLNRVLTREAKKDFLPKTKVSPTNLPQSAASSPLTAGKRAK